jgi:AcrR family transcriptional regulator
VPKDASDDLTDESSDESTDGRHLRRTRNREAVLDAAFELLLEGVVLPTPQQLADRAGVSWRSVYRYFSDRDGWILALGGHVEEHAGTLISLPERGDLPLAEAVDSMIERRLKTYELLIPMARALTAVAHRNDDVRRLRNAQRQRAREQHYEYFARELDELPVARRNTAIAVLDMVALPEVVDHYVLERGIPLDALAPLLRDMLVDILTP